MKNKIKLLFLICLTTILCGCVKYEYTMTLGSDKRFNIAIVDAVQKEYFSSLESSFNEERNNYEQNGYQVEDYVDEQYQGIKVSTTFSSIDDLSNNEEMTVELNKLFDQEKDKIKLFTKNKKQSITISQEEKDLMKENDIDESEYNSSDLELYYSIVLPKNTKLIENNATEFDEENNKLSWTLKYGEVTNIKFSFTLNDKDVTKNDSNFEKVIQSNNENTSNSNNDNNININDEKVDINFFSFILPLLIIIGVIYIIIIMRRKLNSKIFSRRNEGIISHQKPPSFKK